ncbi:hypothetical protein BDF19DRAFT_43677 [Syncephalis fuscata]|nr:hypothetical protein BDF19DRAFT_43677 [Syncephalis fuscata]
MFLSTHSEHFWQNSDILLYLCRFIKDEELVNFATSCRLIYRTTVDRPGYWERQYRKEFCLGDQREQEWFTWYSWYINTIPESKESTSNADQTKQEHLLPATIATVDSGDNEYKLSVNIYHSSAILTTLGGFTLIIGVDRLLEIICQVDSENECVNCQLIKALIEAA